MFKLLISLILQQLAQLIVNAGGVAAVVDYVGESKGNIRLPGIMMLGYVAAHSENLAMAVIVSKVTNEVQVLTTTYNCISCSLNVSRIDQVEIILPVPVIICMTIVSNIKVC